MLSSIEKEKKVFRDTFELLTNSHDGFFSFLFFFCFQLFRFEKKCIWFLVYVNVIRRKWFHLDRLKNDLYAIKVTQKLRDRK